VKILTIHPMDWMGQFKTIGAFFSWSFPEVENYYPAEKIHHWRTTLKTAWSMWQRRRNDSNTPELLKRIASLELDIRDRDAEIRQLRQEYHLQREQTARCQTAASEVALETLTRQLATPLAQLSSMRAVIDAGRSVRVEDLFKMVDKVEQTLIKAGVSRIGTVGAVVPFDSQYHHRLSGPDLTENDPAIIRFVGYRLGETILLKAMVNYYGTSSA